MLPANFCHSQKGYISLVLIIFALISAVLIFPFKFPLQNFSKNDGFRYCREFINDANAQTIDIPTEPGGTQISTHKLIKVNVPIKPGGYKGGHHVEEGPNIFVNGKNFQILYPSSESGRSYDFNTEDGKTDINFTEYGLVFLRHLTDAGIPETVSAVAEIKGVKDAELEIIDIYQDVTKPPIPHAENILKCVDVGIESVIDPVVIVPSQKASDIKEQLQLEWFVVKQAKLLPKSWWTPECKPAIYLYPKQKQLVNVKVFPRGELTYVDPPYDFERGWTVWAEPSGKLNALSSSPSALSQDYDYLYYESKIYDNAINKPAKGWVIKSEESGVKSEEWFKPLEDHFKTILPKLGLNKKETEDFVQYWIKALPQSPYYFVGIVDPGNVDEIEKLEITPKPDSINRVRVYFERLDSPKAVEPPVFPPPSSLLPLPSFSVVEWGGMVKNDPGHPFTCSQ
ncbi:hypothetical protein HYW44_00525 [Candidatus Daviesbacteria bacterium]|nr:hypothetical protein [Candidatus Daviesbacteria bacterium]